MNICEDKSKILCNKTPSAFPAHTVFLRDDNVQKKCKTSLTSFSGLFTSTVSMLKNLVQDISQTIYFKYSVNAVLPFWGAEL